MIFLDNNILKVSVNLKGAELTSIFHQQHGIEYLWHGDAKFWGKHAPVLFPIVGTLKENTYRYAGKTYTMSRHGFARERTFSLIHQGATTASLQLLHDEHSLENYPFKFILRIHYSLEENKLVNRYEVINESEDAMLFSVGGHPAFNVPLQEGLKYDDYYLEFDQPETTERWKLKDNLIADNSVSFLKNESIIHLKHDLFSDDAIVLKHLKSKSIALKSNVSPHGLTMNIEAFPYLGIWAAPEAPFVCIEPWQGIADSVQHNQQLEAKEGIVQLEPKQNWTKNWDVTFW